MTYINPFSDLEGKPIAVGLSGGVDSSVAAFLLSGKTERLAGVSHYIYPNGDCCSPELLDRARLTADRLGIGYYQEDLVDDFARVVINDFVDTYLSGETPNPCVRCNQRMRFFLFYQRLVDVLREKEFLAPGESLRMATGHYARIAETDEGRFLMKGRDSKKDQSYMLYQIRKEMLPNLVFPLGALEKTEVVKIAVENNLPSASARESQDACFIPGKYTDFIASFTNSPRGNEMGDIVDTAGTVLGSHSGYIGYTVGQRQGLGLGNGPWFVIRTEADSNRVIVGRKEELGDTRFRLRECNWFFRDLPKQIEGEVKIRYNSKPVECRIIPEADGTASVELIRPEAVTPGQSAVVYRDDMVLGGGIIKGYL